MTGSEQREAARQFINRWRGKGKEDEDGRSYWIELLSNVFGVENVTERIDFEKKVVVDGNTKRIDVYIPETRVIIEQKSLNVPLNKKIRNSGDIDLTPFEQADRYNSKLIFDERARWIVTCNFAEIWIYDMNEKQPEPTKIMLEELQTKYSLLDFLIEKEVQKISHEMEVSIKAGDIVGLLYNAFLKQYKIPEEKKNETAVEKEKREHKLKSLNALCVRLVFCLYAEDAGIFGEKHNMFHDYLARYEARDCRRALIELFKVLDTEEEDREDYLEEELVDFPYVNGGLFADESVEIPQFTEEIRELLLTKASEEFNWRDISPTIFGAVFESTLNPETRRSGGMHYTSIENIHKVIDPLFLDELQEEFETIQAYKTLNVKRKKLMDFQEKLAHLKFLDPACGSGNFLTETYLSLRRLENKVLRVLYGEGQGVLGVAASDIIKVSIQQFYGIEINDFAVTVAKTALWIAESQMLDETKNIIYGLDGDFLPLKTYVNIVEGNALTLDWNSILSVRELNYIMGNPPFIGGMLMSDKKDDEKRKKDEIRNLFEGVKGAGEFDYVTGWYKKAVEYTLGTSVRCAFVSTNSICQGSHVITFWRHLIEQYTIHIDFAYTTFIWNSEAKDQAKVHCVIVGFSGINSEKKERKLFSAKNECKICNSISPYLTDTAIAFVESRSTPICDVPKMRFGSMPRDGGGFVLSADERAKLIDSEPLAEKWIKPYIGATEFLNNKERYCLWLVGADPSEIKKCPFVKKRVESVRNFRAESKAAGTRKFSVTPTLFCQIAQPDSDYIIVPKTSSGRRRYIPLGFMSKDIIASDLAFLIPNAGLYEFGILMSNDPLTMPPELLKAHIINNKAVMDAYGFSTKMTEADCVAELMQLYQKMILEERKKKSDKKSKKK